MTDNSLAKNTESSNVLQFPVKILKTKTSPGVPLKVVKILKKTDFVNESVEFYLDKWLDLFSWNHHPADLQLLVDSVYEIVRIWSDDYTIDWHVNIWKTLQRPTNKKEIIEARKVVLGQINKLPSKFYWELYETFNSAKELYKFDDAFDSFEDLGGVIKSFERNKKPGLNSENDNTEVAIFDLFWTDWNSIINARKIIPRHIQLLRNIPDLFFQKTADSLFEAFGKIKDFSYEGLKRIYETDDHEAFSEIRSKVAEFCKVFSDWDWILIVARWIKDWHLNNSTIIDDSNLEEVKMLSDARHLMNRDKQAMRSHIPNDVPNSKDLEVYAGWNWSWKSTWLKSRLALQLFHQSYWYVAAEKASLLIRKQIIFINRWWSSYWEDLSAFWNDIKKKLLAFLTKFKKGALVFLDEFWSTIPEKEAYCLIRALEDHLLEKNAKVLLATHNEKYIRQVEKSKNEKKWLYHFDCKMDKNGLPLFRYNLRQWKDSAHTLNIFKFFGMPQDIIRTAFWSMMGHLRSTRKQTFECYPILKYSDEEREILKKRDLGFAWLTRYNDMLKLFYDEKNHWKWFQVVRKFIPLGYKERPNKFYHDEDLFFLAHHPDNLDEVWKLPSFDFKVISKDNKIETPEHLHSKNFHRENIWDSTLTGLVTWWLTNDIKELQERQKFFEIIWEIPFEEVDQIYRDMNTYIWIVNWFTSGNGFWHEMNVNLNDLKKFNVLCWEKYFENFNKYIAFYWTGRTLEWFLDLVRMEEIAWNLPYDLREKHKELFDIIKKIIKLNERWALLQRWIRRRYEDKFKNSKELAEKAKERIEWVLSEMFPPEKYGQFIDSLNKIYDEIKPQNKPIDILTLEKTKIDEISRHIDFSRLFRTKDKYDSESLSDGFSWMMQLIRAFKWTGNLAKPLIDRFRKLDSVYTNNLANYMEDFIHMPPVEEFIELVRLKRDDPKAYEKKRERFYVDRKHQWCILFEINWLVEIANRIKKLGWTKVDYNSTWEIDIKWAYHPSLQKNKWEQTKNDFHLNSEQSFEILEWATMWWKTINIQSMQWIIRLAHSIWYVPAEHATLPVFDWMYYIDRILEKEKEHLSAGQHDAEVWSDIINKVRKDVKEKASNWRYWFAIDEMISSVPARFQKWLVIAIIDELKRLGQRWQVSIHNPELVSGLLDLDRISYKVRHPEVKINETGDLEYTYNMTDWRSINEDWEFSAYSLETAEKLGLDKEIIKRAKAYRKM